MTQPGAALSAAVVGEAGPSALAEAGPSALAEAVPPVPPSEALTAASAVAAGEPAAGWGVRSDSLATAIVIAAASTARPASWPPIWRGSMGTADEVRRASLRTVPFERWGGPEELGLGVTTGNRPDRLPGLTVVFGNVGKSPVGRVVLTVGNGFDWPTTIVIAATAGDIWAPVTVTVSVTWRPSAAVVRTRSVISISSAWLAGSVPIEHEVACAVGQSVNCGGRTRLRFAARLAETRCALTVLQTQTE
jgi:hypothetical protein